MASQNYVRGAGNEHILVFGLFHGRLFPHWKLGEFHCTILEGRNIWLSQHSAEACREEHQVDEEKLRNLTRFCIATEVFETMSVVQLSIFRNLFISWVYLCNYIILWRINGWLTETILLAAILALFSFKLKTVEKINMFKKDILEFISEKHFQGFTFYKIRI